MKYLLALFLALGFLTGCASSNTKGQSFKEQYAALEKEDKNTELDYYNYRQDMKNNKEFMSEGDRFATTQIEAQKERRAIKPTVESNYLFEVYPDHNNTYTFDEYNQVWTDAPPLKTYKQTPRLWKKPKRLSPTKYSGESDLASDVNAEADTGTNADTDHYEYEN